MHPFLSREFNGCTIKKVLLLGVGGVTGRSYARLLAQHGYVVYIHDSSFEKCVTFLREQQNTIYSYEIVLSEQIDSGTILEEVDAVTLTPGICLSLPIFNLCKKKCIPVFSEIEYCLPLLKDLFLIGVTGTNGKSSVVSMIEHVLGSDALACGNIGIPLSRILLEEVIKKHKILIIELSSYQLELFHCEGLDIVVYLNIAEDHLDRYQNMQEYYNTKWNIVSRQSLKKQILLYSSSLLCVDLLDEFSISSNDIKKISSSISSNILLETSVVKEVDLSSTHFKFLDYDGNLGGTNLFLSLSRGHSEFLLDFMKMNFSGTHNQHNILFVVEVLYSLCYDFYLFSEQKLPIIINKLTTCVPLSHRFELFYTAKDCVYIDDSKATTVDSIIKALESLSEKNIFIFLGGRGKSISYEALVSYIDRYNKGGYKIYPILFGEERFILQKIFKRVNIFLVAVEQKLDDAFEVAKIFQIEQKVLKSIFILSPGCTSWDAYSSFEERGKDFQNIVQNYHKAE